VGDPRVLFLDEPTTGLDAVHANEVMAAVKALTVGGEEGGDDDDSDDDSEERGGDGNDNNNSNSRRRGARKRQAPITVCATIHSPTPFAYSLFDSLVLLIGELGGGEGEREREKEKEKSSKKNSFLFFLSKKTSKKTSLQNKTPGGRVAYCGTTEDAAPIRFFQQALMTRVVGNGTEENKPFNLPRFDFGNNGGSGTGELLSSSASLSRSNNNNNNNNNRRKASSSSLPSLSAPEWLLEAVVAADRREGAGEALALAFKASPGAVAVAAAAEEDGCFSSLSASASSTSSSSSGLRSSSSSSGRLPVVSSPTGAQAAAQGMSSAFHGAFENLRSFFSRNKNNKRVGNDGGNESTSAAPLLALAPRPNTRVSTTLTLLRYRMTRDLVDPAWLGPRSLDKLCLTPIIASLYWRVGARENGAADTGALLFLFSILPGYAAASYMPCIVLERPLFIREVADGLYTPASYLAAKMLGESVVYVFVSIAVTAMIWWPCALDGRGDYLAFWAGNLVTTMSGVALGYAVAALSPSMGVANAALPAYVTMLLFFVGLLLPSRSVPVYFKWLECLSFLKYAWRAQMINVFGENSRKPDLAVIEYYSMGDGATAWGQLGIGAGFAAGFMVVAWASLAFVRHQKR